MSHRSSFRQAYSNPMTSRRVGRGPNDDIDMDAQRDAMAAHRRKRHEAWVSDNLQRTKFDHEQSRVRADLIVNEARRLEKEHLQHQLSYARALVRHHKKKQHGGGAAFSSPARMMGGRTIGENDSTPAPKTTLGARRDVNTSHASNAGSFKDANANGSSASSPRRSSSFHHQQQQCDSPDCGSPRRTCGCLQAPLCRQITPKYRALALLKQTFEHDKVEEAWETLRETYASDSDMLEDLIYRYGPEPEDVSPNTRLRCVEDKIDECDAKWRSIGSAAMEDMRYRDAFPNVIRNLSIMRIFLEGSQAPVYGCDTSERARRDAFHQGVLDQLAMERTLFVTPPRERHQTPRSASPSYHH